MGVNVSVQSLLGYAEVEPSLASGFSCWGSSSGSCLGVTLPRLCEDSVSTQCSISSYEGGDLRSLGVHSSPSLMMSRSSSSVSLVFNVSCSRSCLLLSVLESHNFLCILLSRSRASRIIMVLSFCFKSLWSFLM